MDQTKGQWAAGEVAAVISFWLTIPPQERLDPALVSQPCVWCVFSQHLSGTRKDLACQNQGSVFNIIMTAVETVNITQNQREERRTSLGQASGEETNPTLLSTIPGDYRNPLVSTLGAQQRPGVLIKGRASPGAGSGEVVSPGECGSVSPGSGSGDCVGLTPSTWVRIPCTQRPQVCSFPAVCPVPSEIPSI